MSAAYRSPYRPDAWERDIYPMPSFPTLSVSDLERSWRWYQSALGFADVFTMRSPDGRPVIAHLRWCLFGDVLLMPDRAPIETPRGRGITLNFSAEDVDPIAERAREAEATIIEGPVDRPWNTRDVTVLDPDGYRLNFTAPQPQMLERARSGQMEGFDAVIARLRTMPNLGSA